MNITTCPISNNGGGAEQRSSKTLTLSSTIIQDDITDRISNVFDYKFDGTVVEKIKIPVFPSDFQIGLICGSSGSGKSTILRNSFGTEELIEWKDDCAIASHFDSYQEAAEKFGAVGLNSIPSWMKPYRVLSTGEKFRADMARRLKDNAVVDEFTSVVNREVAISCSCSIAKYIRSNAIKNVVFSSCHDDIIPYLLPDWIYNTDTMSFYTGRYLCKPKINIEVIPCRRDTWNLFKKYHYLSGDLNNAADCYVAVMDDVMVGFVAVLSFPCGSFEHGFREHRLVVHPDYQGMGIGNKLSETVADAYLEMGCRYFSKTSNPRVGEHRDRSVLWRETTHNHKKRLDYLGSMEKRKNNEYDVKARELHANRMCYAHEYIGNGQTYPFTYKTKASVPKGNIPGQITFL